MIFTPSLFTFFILVLSLQCLLAVPIASPNQSMSDSNSQYPVLTAQKSKYSTSFDTPSIIRNKMIYLNRLLSGHGLYGAWKGSSKGIASQNQQGYAVLRYDTSYNPYDESLDMVLCLFNDFYLNSNYSCVSFSEYITFIPVSSFNEQNMTLNLNQITVHVAQGFNNRVNGLGKECIVNCSIHLTDTITKMPFVLAYDIEVDKHNFAVQIQLQSTECGLDILTDQMTFNDEVTQIQALNYAIAMSFAAFFQCLLCFYFTDLFEQKKELCQRISQGTLKAINAFDLFIALQCFYNYTTSPFIGFAGLSYVVLALYSEPTAIRAVVLAQGDLKQRGFRSLSYFNFTLLIISTMTAVLSAFHQRPEWMIFIFCFHQFPQIFQNFKTHRKFQWREYLVFLFVLPKLCYIVYVLVSPQNLFRVPSGDIVFIIGANLLGFQLLVLLIQRHYPTLCVKRKVVYQSFTSSERKSTEEICSVCLENFETTTTSNSDSLLKVKTVEIEKMLVTPCNHQFHECCLRDWMKLKSICPYCRFCLPPLPEED